MANQFNQDIAAAKLQKVQAALDVIKTELGPLLISLTPEERKNMLRMGDKTVAFVQKTTDYASTNPSFVPPFVKLDELKQDAAGLAALAPILRQLEQLSLDTDSTLMVAGSEAYTNALTIYQNIKFQAQNHQQGAQAAYEELRVRFPGSSNAGRKPSAAKAG
jgi:hypothetical protein